jgi:DinB superfamily
MEVLMSTAVIAKTEIPTHLDVRVHARVLEEGYGPGAWHGADLRAAFADVTPELAFRRPAPGRHNIAEIALHHAYCARSVRGQLAGRAPGPFVVEGEDWFELNDEARLTWPRIQIVVEAEQEKLAAAIASLDKAGTTLSDAERFDLVLGITCHAIYHAGQVQLIKRLAAG